MCSLPRCSFYVGTTIGHDNLLGDFCSIREECRIGNNCIISRNVSVNYNTVIGNDIKIMDNTHITGNTKIENHVFICFLVATTNDGTMGREGYNPDHVYGVEIEDDITIGAVVNIPPHVVIGRNAIVGAGAVVTKNVTKK